MFYIRDEGEALRNGFNFYPMSSSNTGFILKVGRTLYFIRYSDYSMRIRLHWGKM